MPVDLAECSDDELTAVLDILFVKHGCETDPIEREAIHISSMAVIAEYGRRAEAWIATKALA